MKVNNALKASVQQCKIKGKTVNGSGLKIRGEINGYDVDNIKHDTGNLDLERRQRGNY